jgi:hypothetical protein
MGKWAVTKKDRLGPGQLWQSKEGGQRLICKIDKGRVWYWTIAFPPAREGTHKRPYGQVSVERFVIWSSLLVKAGVDYHNYKHRMEVTNAREENRRAG